MFSGYLCKNCKTIPLVKAFVTIDKDIRFMVKCKCSNKYITFNELNSNYYSKNIDKSYIKNNNEIEDIKKDGLLVSNMKEMLKKMNTNNKNLNKMKNIVINFLNSIVKEMEKIFDNVKRTNENFEKIAKILIESYESIGSNYSNVVNLIYNTYNNYNVIDIKKIEILNDKNKIHLSMENIMHYIEEILPIKKFSNNLEYITDLKLEPSKMLRVSNEFLLLKTYNYLCIQPIKDLNKIKEYNNWFYRENNSKVKDKILNKLLENRININTSSLIDFDIDRQNNILCLYSNFVKILPKITYDKIKNFKKKSLVFIPEIEFEPLLEINIKDEFINILSLKDEIDGFNRFILYNKKIFLIFKYNLKNKIFSNNYSLKIEVYKIYLVNYENNNLIIIFNSSNIFLFDLSKLIITKKTKIKFFDENISINQINNNELLITNNKFIYILKIGTFKIKLKIKCDDFIVHSFLLNNKSIVICQEKCAKRYSLKTFEFMCNFKKINTMKINNYYNNNGLDYICIKNSLQLSDSKILLVYKYGECDLYNLMF